MFANTENISLIDSHCHLDFEAFNNDRERVLENCYQLGITDILVPGVTSSEFNKLISLCEITNKKPLSPKLHYSLGLHPVFLDEHTSTDLMSLEKTVQQTKPVAIGEIGLDFFIKTLDKQAQIELFTAQLDIAEQYQLPIILHVRKAHDEVIKLIHNRNIKGGIVHAFNGSIQQAHKYIDLGFKLGFGGMITYTRSKKLHTLAKNLPLESIVLETDAPDMTVSKYQGQRNSPEYLIDVLNAAANILNIPTAQLANSTCANFNAVITSK